MDNIKKFEVKIREEDDGMLIREAIKSNNKDLNLKLDVKLNNDYNLNLEFQSPKYECHIDLTIIITDNHGLRISKSTFEKLDDERLVYNVYKLYDNSYTDTIYLKITKESGNDIYAKVYNHESIIYNSTHKGRDIRNIFNYSNFKNEEDLYLCCFAIISNIHNIESHHAEEILNKLYYYGYESEDIDISKTYCDETLQSIINNMGKNPQKKEIIEYIIKYVEVMCIAKVNNIEVKDKFSDTYVTSSLVKDANNMLMF